MEEWLRNLLPAQLLEKGSPGKHLTRVTGFVQHNRAGSKSKGGVRVVPRGQLLSQRIIKIIKVSLRNRAFRSLNCLLV